MADPTESATAADPQARGDNQPEDSSKELAVVDLSDAGNEKAQDTGIPGF